jgi:peptidyl-prolyl cis-trans isomerase A (cyclophilin A)
MNTLLIALALSATNPALLAPEKATATAPKLFKVKVTTTKGDFVLEVHRDWAPHGADRFYNLVKLGFFTDLAFFRAIKGFMVQFGINGDPAVSAKWAEANIPDDPVNGHNQRGEVTFAMAGPNTRTTQIFINYADNSRLDGMGFAPFARVVKGMEVVDALNTEYGEGAPGGRGPAQDRAQSEGNAYFKASFPNLDYVKSATLVSGKAK